MLVNYYIYKRNTMNNIIEKTLIIIKPDALAYANQIEWAILDAGFTILNVNIKKI